MWMCIKKTKTRSSLGSGKMMKTTKGLCATYIKNKKREKSIPWGNTVQFNRWPRENQSTQLENFFFQIRSDQTTIKEEPNFRELRKQ